jgi:hypothetical protein
LQERIAAWNEIKLYHSSSSPFFLHARSNLFYHADVSSFFFNCVMQQMLQISTRFKIKQMTQISMFFLLPPPIFLPRLETPMFQAILVKKMFMCGAPTQLLPPRRTWLPKRVVVGRNQTLSLCKAGFSDSARPGVLHQRS